MNDQALIEQSLNTDNFQSIIELCSEYLDNPIVIISNSFDIIGHSQVRQPDDESWLLSVSRGYITMEFSHVLSQWPNLKQFDHKTNSLLFEEISQYRRKFYKLSFKGENLGYLNITEYSSELETHSQQNYELVKMILSKEIHTSKLAALQHHKNNDEHFLFACCEGLYSSKEHLREHFMQTTLARCRQFQFILINLDHLESYNANRDTLKEDITKILPYAIQIIHHDYLVILDDSKQISEHKKQLHSYMKLHAFQAYLSLVAAQPEEFTKTYQKTQHAKRLCQLTQNKHELVAFEHLLFTDLLDQASRSMNLKSFVHPVLLEIYEYDTLYKTEYLPTLLHYTLSNHSILKTASLMYIHRNTVSYRLGKIHELFNLDLNKGEELFNCYYSSLIMTLLSKQKEI